MTASRGDLALVRWGLALALVLKAGDLLGTETGDLDDLFDGVAALEHLLGVLDGVLANASLLTSEDSDE